MVDTQHFCLRWNNYQSSITSAFENLRDDEDFVDVTLACDGKSLKAHRVVLSACSPYFRELLKSTPCKHPVIVLQDVAWSDLHALVEFIYHGEVNVHQRSLSSFLKTAEVLRVSGLTQKHADDRDQLAQVQSLVRAQQQSTPNHHPAAFPDRLPPDAESMFASPSSPPHGATVNQLLRRAALHHHHHHHQQHSQQQQRRERRISHDPGSASVEEHASKRTRTTDHLNNNNNDINLSHHLQQQQQQQQQPPQTQPTDFSPSAMKNNNILNSLKNECEVNNGIIDGGGGGVGGGGSSGPGSPAADRNDIKAEPMDLLCSTMGGGAATGGGTGDDSNDSTTAAAANDGVIGVDANGGPGGGVGGGIGSTLSQGPHSGGSSGGGGDHDDHDSPLSAPYLTTAESKLFASAAGSFNFSMAALAADPTGLGGLNASLQGNDGLAGTSQGADEFRCQPCNKSLSSLTRLKRHIQNVHMRPSREPVCNICKRVYSSLNSLRNHKSIYHRNVKNNIKTEEMLAAAAAAAAAASGAAPPPPPPPHPHHSFYL